LVVLEKQDLEFDWTNIKRILTGLYFVAKVFVAEVV